MGMTVKLELPPVTVQVDAVKRRAMLAAAEPVLVAAVAGAPTEPVAKHGEHLRDTAYMRLEADAGLDRVALGFAAYWALWQHEDMGYHHPHGGHAKFLELAMIEGYEAWLERVAALTREAIA